MHYQSFSKYNVFRNDFDWKLMHSLNLYLKNLVVLYQIFLKKNPLYFCTLPNLKSNVISMKKRCSFLIVNTC